MIRFAIAALATATVCSDSVVIERSSPAVVHSSPAVVKSNVVQRVIEVDSVPETQVVLGDDSEVLFFVSPEYRHAQLYPQRQHPNVEEIRAIIRQELEAFRAEIRQGIGQQTQPMQMQNAAPNNQPPPLPAADAGGSVVGQYCSTCHGGNTPKAQFLLLASGSIDDTTARKAIARITAGTMPVDANGEPIPLDMATRFALVQELSGRK